MEQMVNGSAGCCGGHIVGVPHPDWDMVKEAIEFSARLCSFLGLKELLPNY